jgi:hypothetical protein
MRLVLREALPCPSYSVLSPADNYPIGGLTGLDMAVAVRDILRRNSEGERM